jgi:hypothetical protein
MRLPWIRRGAKRGRCGRRIAAGSVDPCDPVERLGMTLLGRLAVPALGLDPVGSHAVALGVAARNFDLGIGATRQGLDSGSIEIRATDKKGCRKACPHRAQDRCGPRSKPRTGPPAKTRASVKMSDALFVSSLACVVLHRSADASSHAPHQESR